MTGSFAAKQPRVPQLPKAGDVGRLILVRHGQTHANVRRILDTALPGAALTDTGISQARLLGKTLAWNHDRLGIVATSEALRARQTGTWAVSEMHRYVETDQSVLVTKGLKEVNAGELEGRRDRAAHLEFGSYMWEWLRGDTGKALPGGESLDDVVDRFEPIFASMRARYLEHGRDAVVVAHGAAIRLMGHVLAGVDGQWVLTNSLPNTGMVVLEPKTGPSGRRWRVASWDGAMDVPLA